MGIACMRRERERERERERFYRFWPAKLCMFVAGGCSVASH